MAGQKSEKKRSSEGKQFFSGGKVTLEDVEEIETEEEKGARLEDEERRRNQTDVVEEDEDDEFYTKAWWIRKAEENEKEQSEKEESESEKKRKKVAFVTAGVQWLERQRASREVDVRIANLCGFDGGPEPTISDSGTNIDVCSRKTARFLQGCGLRYFEVKKGDPKQCVIFGKEDAREQVIGHMYGEGLMGKVAVVENVAANLISVGALTQRGLEVRYTKDRVEILKKGGEEVLFIGPYDPETRLYHLDIIHLMLAPAPTEEGASNRGGGAKGQNGQESFAGGAKEKPKTVVRFKARALRLGMELHKNFRHVPFSTMADNVECGAWKGLDPDITPALLRELSARRACIVCAVSRWNQEHREGSGARVYEVGRVFAFDYQGKFSPTSRNGETGEFLFTDLGSGLTRRYGERGDKTKVADAVRLWCTFMLSHGHVPRMGRHDSGSVETGKQFKVAMAEMQIEEEMVPIETVATPPGIAEKNIERVVQTHKEDMAAILSASPLLDARDWDIASEHACTVRSTIVNASSRLKGDGTKSPYELVTGRVPRVEVFERYGIGDIGVCKRAAADAPGHGEAKNEVVQIVAIEVDDAKGVIVERLGTRSRVRRGDFRKVHLLATEPSVEAQQGRTAKFTEENKEGVVVITFVVEGGDNVSAKSLRQLAEQEAKLANERELEEFESIASRVKAGKHNEEETHEQQEEQDYNPTYWGPNEAFWAKYVETLGMPTQEYASRVYAFTARTGVELEIFGDDDETGAEAGSTGAETQAAEAAVVGGSFAFAAKHRVTRDESNPSRGMLKKNEELAERWHPSMVKERGGIAKTSHVVTKEYAETFGVTPHVTARTTKRDGTLKTRFAIDGSFEIRRGKFPNRDVLYSPAMDDELLRFCMQATATFCMEMGKSDVAQCFTHNPMATARYPRKIIVFMDEYESGVQGGEYREFDSVSYGTADASSEWYINLKAAMEEWNFKTSVHHPCLFVKGAPETNDLIMVGTATDDFLRMNLPTPEARAAMADFKRQLDEKWPMVHTDMIDEVLGVAVKRGMLGSVMCTQPAEMKKIRAAFFGDDVVPEVLVPLHPDINPEGGDSEGPGEEDADESELDRENRITSYRSLLGKLGYVRVTRIDVLHTLSVLAERAHRPTRRDRHALFWLAAYLLTTEEMPLTFYPGGPDSVTATGVLKWSFFGDCSWRMRSNFYSCISHMVVHGDLSTEESRLRKPFTAPVAVKTIKEKGPPSQSASAGELHATVAAIKSGMAIRGMSDEIAGVAEPLSLERMPEGGAPASPLLTDNASNERALSTQTSKKPKGLRVLARELSFAKFHAEEGSVDIIAVPANQQRANPLTKALRSAAVHLREAEWLMGTSLPLRKLQDKAESNGRSKKSWRPEAMAVAGFAGFGSSRGERDTVWATRMVDRRETIDRSDEEEEQGVVDRNTRANSSGEYSFLSIKLRGMLEKRSAELAAVREESKWKRQKLMPRRGKENAFAANWHTHEELAALIFQPLIDELMFPLQKKRRQQVLETEAPSDDEAREERLRQEEQATKIGDVAEKE